MKNRKSEIQDFMYDLEGVEIVVALQVLRERLDATFASAAEMGAVSKLILENDRAATADAFDRINQTIKDYGDL